jgi:hypothetical protein
METDLNPGMQISENRSRLENLDQVGFALDKGCGLQK